MGLLRFLLVCVVTLLTCFLPSWTQPNSPIVIGILGNQLEGKLNKTDAPHIICKKHTDDFITLWLAVTDLIPGGKVDCLSDNLRLVYDPATGKYNDPPGIETRIPGFGNTSTIEFLDPDTKWFSSTKYFHAMVQHFVDKGYVRGKSIVGAPYDWRYSPNQYIEQGYYDRLKQLIENTSSINGNKPVVLVAHSMGSPTTLYFLTKIVDQPWKDKYIRDYITISGVWRGAAKAVKAFVSGDNEGIWIVPNGEGRAGSRTYPANSWLLPFPSEDTWPSTDVIVVTPQRNYSVWDYKDLFQDMKYSRGYDMFLEIQNLTGAMPPPNVTLHCLYGTGVNTPMRFEYGEGQFPDTQPTTITGDGDGTVNINSLMSCKKWIGAQSYNVTLKGFPNVEHVQTIREPDIITYVDGVVYGTLPH